MSSGDAVDWIREGEVPFSSTLGDTDRLRAWGPWVLEESNGTLRMWYADPRSHLAERSVGHRVGSVLEPELGEVAVSYPCALEAEDHPSLLRQL